MRQGMKGRKMLRPVCVDMLAPMLTSMELQNGGFAFLAGSLGLNREYRESCAREYPEDWQEAADYLIRWIRYLRGLYCRETARPGRKVPDARRGQRPTKSLRS
jgi:hypothetical protein